MFLSPSCLQTGTKGTQVRSMEANSSKEDRQKCFRQFLSESYFKKKDFKHEFFFKKKSFYLPIDDKSTGLQGSQMGL